MAEIVAESVCRKLLVLEAQEKSWEFHWADEKEDYLIANSVLAELHRRMREFVVIACSIMLENKELPEEFWFVILLSGVFSEVKEKPTYLIG